MSPSTPGSGSLFVDLSTAGLGGPNFAGVDPHTTVTGSGEFAAWSSDSGAFAKGGDVALGGLAMDDDGQTLWTVNLASQALVKMNIGSGPTPTAPTSIGSYPVPTTWCTANGKGKSKAFAVAAHDGDVFVGGVCAGVVSPGVAPVAFVYRFSAGVYSATPVLTQDMGYIRAAGIFGPWGNSNIYNNPEPMLTGITFVDEDMVLGFRGRDTPIAGEILRACQSAANTWLVEFNGTATCPYSASTFTQVGSSPGTGPGGREFYWGDGGFHVEQVAGGVAQVAGHPNVQTSMTDPFTTYSGGLGSLSNVTGGRALVRTPASRSTGTDLYPSV